MRTALPAILFLTLLPDCSALACEFERGDAVAVAEVVDAGLLRLSDGRLLKLAGMEVPRISLKGGAASREAVEARDRLRSLVLEGNLALPAGKLRRDRYDRVVSSLLLSDGQSAQQRLVAEGYARVMPRGEAAACTRDLLAEEARAREGRRGFWKSIYAILDARDVAALERLEGTYQIVEGRVMSAASVRGRIYLNFGDDRRSDFTVTVEQAQAKLFEAHMGTSAGAPAIEGRRVRVRGFLTRFNGPEMTIDTPAAIEVLDGDLRGPAATAGEGGRGGR